MQAGRRAQQLYANEQAREHYQKALNSAGRLPAETTLKQRQAIHAGLGELLVSTGQFEPGREHLQQSLELAISSQDCEGEAHACRWLARLYELQGEYGPALSWIERGLAVCGAMQMSEKAQMRLIEGLIYLRQGKYVQSLEACQDALRVAEALAQGEQVIARSHELWGATLQAQGESISAIEHASRALELHRQAGNLYGQAMSTNQLANLYGQLGKGTEAGQRFREALQIFTQIGDLYNQAIVSSNLGYLALRQGQLEEARRRFQDAIGFQERIGSSPWLLGMFNLNLAQALIGSGDLAAARQYLATSQEYFVRIKAHGSLPEVFRLFAELERLDGNFQAAEEHGQAALSRAKELEMASERGNALRVLGQIAHDQGQYGAAEEYLAQSLACLDEAREPYERALSQLALARIFYEQSRRQEAKAVLEACIPVFQRVEAALDLQAAQALRAQLG